jgi:DNA modification methylase
MADQIGLEQTPDAFVAELVAVFREVKRVLRNDGTLWLNLGDSYARNAGPEESKLAMLHTMGVGQKKAHEMGAMRKGENRPPEGLKPKDLIGIPWRVAFALQTDGWYLRQDIIWHKPNPMPESVKDRCTKAHEYIFLLSKSDRYYYDADAIAEPAINDNMPGRNMTDTRLTYGEQNGGNSGLRDLKHRYKTGDWPETRNRRSVWTVPTSPYKGAHFATFPPDLIEPCIKAGSKAGDIVLDPFGGAGTTGLVADRMGRNALLCELNPEYAKMAETRIRDENPMFATVSLEAAP